MRKKRKKRKKRVISKKYIFSLLILVCVNSTFAQINKIPCIDRLGRFDFYCKCQKKKTCMSSLNSSEKKSLKKLNETTPYAMKITKKSIPTLKLMKNALNGQYTTDNFPYKQFDDFDKDMEKVNKKLIKMAEKKMQEMKIRPYKVEERAEYYRNKENKIYEKVARARRKMPKALGGYTQDVESRDSQLIAKKNDNSVSESNNIVEKKKDLNSIYKDVSGKVSNYMKKKFKIGENIHAKDKNLFKAISNRYQARVSSLDQKAIYSAMSVRKEDFKTFFNSINKKLY